MRVPLQLPANPFGRARQLFSKSHDGKGANGSKNRPHDAYPVRCRVPGYYEPCSERLRVCQIKKCRQLKNWPTLTLMRFILCGCPSNSSRISSSDDSNDVSLSFTFFCCAPGKRVIINSVGAGQRKFHLYKRCFSVHGAYRECDVLKNSGKG